MSQRLIDDALWNRIEPLISARRRGRGHRAGRRPHPDRAVLTGIPFVRGKNWTEPNRSP
jgi:hypothetical protein